MPTVPLNKKDPERYYAVLDRLSEGATIVEIMREFRMDYYTVKKYFPNAGRPDLQGGVSLAKSNPEKYREIGRMVAEGASLNEILRSTGSDPRTVKKYFPNAGWAAGGAGKSAQVKRANEELRKMDGYGNISGTRRKEG